MPGVALPLDYSIVKFRPLASEHSSALDIRARIKPFPPATFPSFLVYVEYNLPHNLVPEGPSFQLSPEGDSGKFYHANLGFNPQFGTPSITGGAVGRVALSFDFTLPDPQAQSFLITMVFRDHDGAVQRHDIGEVRRLGSRWHSSTEPNYAVAETRPTRADALTPAFIGGAPKSGTTWLQILLNQHRDILVRGEGQFLGVIKACNYRATNHWFPPAASYGQDLDIVHHALITFMFEFYGRELGCSHVIDRSPGNTKHYRRLLALVPEAMILHCIRHPLDVVVSRLFHERALLFAGQTSELAEHQTAIERTLPTLDVADRLQVDLTQPAVWRLTSAILDEWIAAQREAQAVSVATPDRIMIVRYEAMLSDAVAGCSQIFSFLGVNFSNDDVRDAVNRASFENLTSRERGQADNKSFFRVGTPKQYLSAFTATGRRMALDYVGRGLDSASVFGYAGGDGD